MMEYCHFIGKIMLNMGIIAPFFANICWISEKLMEFAQNMIAFMAKY